jgi:hypothetical protein
MWRRVQLKVVAVGISSAVAGCLPLWGASPGTWQVPVPMIEARNSPRATLLRDGGVLVTGGEGVKDGQFVNIASAELFDPKTNTFRPTGSMEVDRYAHATVRLLDGRVLVLGGVDDQKQVLASAEVFDPSTGIFSPVGDMTTPRAYMTATLLPDGHVLVADEIDDTPKALPTAELFDPATSTFQAAGSLVGPRQAHSAVPLEDGRVAIVGGFDGANAALRRVEIYDPTTGVFSSQGQTAVDHLGASLATLLPGNKVLVSGARYAEIYDPDSALSKITGSLSVARVGHTAVALADGRVLLAGGWRIDASSPTAVSTAELVDPVTGQLSLAPPLASTRAQGASVLLLDGRALILGGIRVFGTARVVSMPRRRSTCLDQPRLLIDPATGRTEWGRAPTGRGDRTRDGPRSPARRPVAG